MLSWIIQISLISIIFIFLVHHLIGFFKSTLTVPKIKDLVNSPSQKYQNMFNTISKGDSYSNSDFNSSVNSNSYTAIDLLPTEIQTDTTNNVSFVLDTSTKDHMKDELKSFLKKQMNSTGNNGLDSSALQSNIM
jgi:hypothetical protein